MNFKDKKNRAIYTTYFIKKATKLFVAFFMISKTIQTIVFFRLKLSHVRILETSRWIQVLFD